MRSNERVNYWERGRPARNERAARNDLQLQGSLRNRGMRCAREAGEGAPALSVLAGLVALRAIDSAVVASGTSVMNMYVLDARVGEETIEMFFQIAALDHVRDQHHARRIIAANG